jgi:hypothetical protein
MIYFVTETYIKDYTNVAENVDSNNIIPFIKNAADSYVRSIIGNEFYKYLLDAYNNQTLDSDEVELVQDYIKQSVAWRAAADIIVEASYQLTNKGVQIQSGDFSSSPEFKAIMFNYHHTSDKASLYDDLLARFLVKDKNKYPQFWADDNKDATARRLCEGRNNFNQNIFFI